MLTDIGKLTLPSLTSLLKLKHKQKVANAEPFLERVVLGMAPLQLMSYIMSGNDDVM